MSAVKQMVEDFRTVGVILNHHIGLCTLAIQTLEAQEDTRSANVWKNRMSALEDLLLEIEAQDIEFPLVEPTVPVNQRGANDSLDYQATMASLLADEESDC